MESLRPFLQAQQEDSGKEGPLPGITVSDDHYEILRELTIALRENTAAMKGNKDDSGPKEIGAEAARGLLITQLGATGVTSALLAGTAAALISEYDAVITNTTDAPFIDMAPKSQVVTIMIHILLFASIHFGLAGALGACLLTTMSVARLRGWTATRASQTVLYGDLLTTLVVVTAFLLIISVIMFMFNVFLWWVPGFELAIAAVVSSAGCAAVMYSEITGWRFAEQEDQE